ncbi:ferritin heavy polypeptide-like 17 [Dendroctonus ponderosae]
MKAFLIFAAVVAAVSANECYKDVLSACRNGNTLSKQQGLLSTCDSKYGAIDAVEGELQRFTNSLLYKSFDFLILSTHYGNYLKNRPGFEKLFRGLSDGLWEDTINSIKYITSRGGEMSFSNIDTVNDVSNDAATLELYELHSLGKALDIEKKLAEKAFDIHKAASGHKTDHHDPEVAHHLEEKFMSKQRNIIRDLAGYTKDLSQIMDTPDVSLGLYLFDEYLQKVVD